MTRSKPASKPAAAGGPERSIRRLRWTALASALLALALPSAAAAGQAPRELVLDHGHTSARSDPFIPSGTAHTAQAQAPPATAPTPPPAPTPQTFAAALAALAASGQITAATQSSDLADYLAARHSLHKLRGTRHRELAAVIANLQLVARAGMVSPSSLAALMLTLDRNRQWWTTGPLLGANQYVAFPGSLLVWEYYPGQGIEIQWLATFGKANAYWSSGTHNQQLGEVLDEAVALAAQQAGGIAWQYLFRFDGGTPPWVSGLAQGTAIQALARASQRLHRPDYATDARSALGIFQMSPPQGINVPTPAGSHYLQYSYAPQERILNGFIQALVGLWDYATITGDPEGWTLFNAGDAEARVEVPQYDTGAWSMYDQSTESDLSYHDLLTQFLENLCTRTRASEPLDAVYCTTAQNFTAYLHDPPVLTVSAPPSTSAGRTAYVRFTLSKISQVTLSVPGVFSETLRLGHGSHALRWRPRKAGTYSVVLLATDLAGNSARASTSVTIKPPSHG